MGQAKVVKIRFGRSEEARASQRRKTDQRITDAVLEVVRSGGPDAVTMEAVSAASGVAKTTLYRRYHDRYDLLHSVAAQLAAVECPTTGLAPSDLTALLTSLQGTFVATVGYASSGRLLSRSEDLLDTWRKLVVQPRIDAVADFFTAGVSHGALRPDVDYAALVECLVGGIVMCATMRGNVPDDWADHVVGTIWPVVAVCPATVC
ncbi:MAG: TetR/AcrR family transcriptional regulator [Propionibacteriaceae bacterium]|nr:TetR/AcrR family transcriptional regulator [Propionibacteriaceae bacterium]